MTRDSTLGVDIRADDIELVTDDERHLPATLFHPASPNGIAVQINSASLTPRRYYRAFASYLAGRGFTVLSYDYRANLVKGPALRFERSGILDWGRYDQSAATAYLRGHYPQHRLVVVAHSLGGQILGLSPLAGEARAILMVATAHGYWRRWSMRQRAGLLLHACVALPLQLAVLGYAPWGLGRGMALSAQAARDFRRFQFNPAFFCDDQGFPLRPYNALIRVPLRHLTFSDDSIVPPGTEIDLEDFFPNAKIRHDRCVPQQFGAAEVGHFGFFRRAMPTPAWDEAAGWLRSAAADTVNRATSSVPAAPARRVGP